MTTEVRVSPTSPGGDWDTFVSSLPAGSLSQSTGWADFHRLRGNNVEHLVAREGSKVVGGAILVVHRLPLGRAMGHVARGPVGTDAKVIEEVADVLSTVAASMRLDPVIVDPADALAASVLERAGFVPAKIGITLPATVVVDVNHDDDVLLSAMKSKTRYNIRKALRSGVRVRMGGVSDATVFEQLLTDTGRRQGFVADGANYVKRAFEAIPSGDIALFVAEHDGVDLAAILVAAFGERATYKRGGWSGRGGNLHPNEALHWAAMRWARETGRTRYDFDGVDLKDIESPTATRTVSHFKTSFGGRVIELPPTLVRFRNPALRLAHERVGARTMRRVKRVARRLQVVS